MKTFFAFAFLFLASSTLAGDVPDPKLTSGDTLDVSTETLCKPGYSASVRNVPESEKKAVYAEYGIKYYKGIGKDYEIDHFLSLEIQGSNKIINLWPEPMHINLNGYDVGAKTKDLEENRLHRLVCEGKISLKQAQDDIRKDWIAAYKRDIGPLPKYKSEK